MKTLSVITMGLLFIGLTVSGCSLQMSGQGDAGWVTLLDGSNPKTSHLGLPTRAPPRAPAQRFDLFQTA